MPELLLLRHAKSDWKGKTLGDFDRPLAPRGRRAAPRLGRFLADKGLVPDLILCSPARRAVETVELLLTALASPPETRYLKTLYLATPSRLLAVLRRQGPDRGRILLVAHNPGLHHLALALTDRQGLSGEAGQQLAEKFATAGLARFQVESWPRLGQSGTRLLDFVRPRDLEPSPEDAESE